MVWRSNIKVLGLKAKALPFMISAVFHVLIIFAFTAVNHGKERVFDVELVLQEINGDAVLKSKTDRKMTVAGSKAMEAGNLEHKPAPVVWRHEGAVRQADEAMKSEDVVLQSTPHPNPLPQGEITPPPSAPPLNPSRPPLKLRGGEGGVMFLVGRGSYELEGDEVAGGRLIAASHKGVIPSSIEGDFGSINGPSFLKMIKPEYPRLARRLGKEGKVVLRLFIDEHGKLVSVELAEKAGYGFDEAAVEAVKASSFRPAKVNGHPVSCKAALPVRFRLE
ncbi:MAG: hypothetical protein CVV37_05590 [Nitrospira bacterium HGW-Nitrospira-1]|nr:MAG: hypothetical protein CVV37_05590 [Nitrospira bacterium HGW-Nitrospira-1]